MNNNVLRYMISPIWFTINATRCFALESENKRHYTGISVFFFRHKRLTQFLFLTVSPHRATFCVTGRTSFLNDRSFFLRLIEFCARSYVVQPVDRIKSSNFLRFFTFRCRSAFNKHRHNPYAYCRNFEFRCVLWLHSYLFFFLFFFNYFYILLYFFPTRNMSNTMCKIKSTLPLADVTRGKPTIFNALRRPSHEDCRLLRQCLVVQWLYGN